jgi:hypothetical protein
VSGALLIFFFSLFFDCKFQAAEARASQAEESLEVIVHAASGK